MTVPVMVASVYIVTAMVMIMLMISAVIVIIR